MTYLVNDIFYTLQGEGYWTGRPAVFVRFSRCNLWTGREEDRATAICRFCDTDFTHANRMTADQIAAQVRELWDGDDAFVVLTGGEPTLQVDDELLTALQPAYIAIETNGTRPVPDKVDWVCVSPKAGAPLYQDHGDELKVVWPQPGLDLDVLRQLRFDHYWLSPMDGPDKDAHTATVFLRVLADQCWRLNIQTHKVIGVK